LVIFRNKKGSFKEKIQIFRKLRILTTYGNHAFTWILVPLVLVWIPGSLGIASAFGAIRFYNILTIFEYIPLPALVNNMIVVLAVSMIPATRVHEESNKLHKSLKQNLVLKSMKINKREINSLLPFGLRIGIVGQVRGVGKVAILICYSYISNYLFSFLISYPAELSV
jgi:hypothetical protein